MPNSTDQNQSIPTINPGFASTQNPNTVVLEPAKKMNPKMVAGIVIVGFLVLFGIAYALFGNTIFNKVNGTMNSTSAAMDLNNAFSGNTKRGSFVTIANVMNAELMANGTSKSEKVIANSLYLDSNFKISNMKELTSADNLLAEDVLIDSSISLGFTANYMGKVYNFPKGSFKLSVLKPDANMYVKATVTNDALDQIQDMYPTFGVDALSLFNDKYIMVDIGAAKQGIDDSIKSIKESDSNPVNVTSQKIPMDFLAKFALSNAVTYSSTNGVDSAGNKVRNISVTVDHEKAKPLIVQFATDMANEQMKSHPCTDDKAKCDEQMKMITDLASSIKIENLKFVLDDKTGSLNGYSVNLSIDDNGKSILNTELKKAMPDSTDEDISAITDIKLNLNSQSTFTDKVIEVETPAAPLDLTKMLGNFLGL